MMIENKDYTDTFAPTASPTSIHLIAAIAAHYGLPLKAADFETAFLNSPMDTTVYIKTPAGFEQWARHGLKGLEGLPKDFLPGDEVEPKGCRLLIKGIPGIESPFLSRAAKILARLWIQATTSRPLRVLPHQRRWPYFGGCVGGRPVCGGPE
jgi:hypothetical protein